MIKVEDVSKLSIGISEETNIGKVWVAVSQKGVKIVRIGGSKLDFTQDLLRYGSTLVDDFVIQAQEARRQIVAYLQGSRKQFDLPLDWSTMSAFQAGVMRIVCDIPYGKTRTYGQIAVEMGKPGAARAVGRANATNPLPLLIPCHRVIASDGGLRGYGAGEGLKTKAFLLAMEKAKA